MITLSKLSTDRFSPPANITIVHERKISLR